MELYEEEYFSEINEASLLYMMQAEGPQPPVIDRTMGVNVPCSTSITHFSYTPTPCIISGAQEGRGRERRNNTQKGTCF